MKRKKLDLLGVLMIVLLIVVGLNIGFDTITKEKIETTSKNYLKAENMSVTLDTPSIEEITTEPVVEEVVIEEEQPEWVWPTNGGYSITSYYGYRWGRLHAGIDISGTGFGSNIYSSTSGIVIETNKNCSNYGFYGNTCGGKYGNYIKIKSDNGYTVIYAHLKNNILVSNGNRVNQGDTIAYMGSSGSATGTHLHFEIRNANNNSLNPCSVTGLC